jgi:3-phenylpropionate/trans-cinnamate dioxygenase ferredoxin component
MTWIDATAAGLQDGTLVAVNSGAVTAVLARAEGAWHAVDSWCTHAECPLSDGWVEGSALRCACHGALFDLASGAPLEGPADEPVTTYPTRVVAGRVEVDLP